MGKKYEATETTGSLLISLGAYQLVCNSSISGWPLEDLTAKGNTARLATGTLSLEERDFDRNDVTKVPNETAETAGGGEYWRDLRTEKRCENAPTVR